jgi:hypothetical protein
MDLDSNLT